MSVPYPPNLNILILFIALISANSESVVFMIIELYLAFQTYPLTQISPFRSPRTATSTLAFIDFANAFALGNRDSLNVLNCIHVRSCK